MVLVHYLVAKPDGTRALRVSSQGALDASASAGLGAAGLGEPSHVRRSPLYLLFPTLPYSPLYLHLHLYLYLHSYSLPYPALD